MRFAVLVSPPSASAPRGRSAGGSKAAVSGGPSRVPPDGRGAVPPSPQNGTPVPGTASFQHAVVELLFAPVGGGLHERQHDGVWLLFRRRELRLEQCRQIEAMRGRFDGANLALRTARYDGEPGLHRHPFEVRVDLEVAEEFFGHGLLILAVKRLQIGAGAQANFGNRAGELGSVALAAGNGAGHRVNHDVVRSRVVFSGVGVLDVEHVACEFDKGVLEPATGAEKRPVPPPRELDSLQHAVETFVRTAGRSPDAVEALELFFRFG